MQLMRLKMVLLPAPLGPTMAKISPSFRSKLTPSTALMPPKAIEMLSASNRGDVRAAPGAGADAVREAALSCAMTLIGRAPAAIAQPCHPGLHARDPSCRISRRLPMGGSRRQAPG